ncbi:ATP-binding protein [Streptacidiphilus melanogenes]|uniref:ATP-binding protein n=1 Tax=Streptacidiphilus melanogenes TaxID=411235 RepID=UPI0006950E4E|nr:tetratricopeptide repeat protein [Streptacidiphilus melanogenes]
MEIRFALGTMEGTSVEFGSLLRGHRVRLGWTQEELADRSGVSTHAISVLERGRRRPRPSSVLQLARALGLDEADRQQLIGLARENEPDSRQGEAPLSGPRCQLPADTRFFVGRDKEVGWLLGLAEPLSRGPVPAPPTVAAIAGMGGVGKSALAVHAAHRLRDGFPDGQLFIDLHGNTPGLDPLTPRDALGSLLRGLQVPAQAIPHGVQECAALYRERLADTRALVVLDNAASTGQVRPLLPGTGGCLVLITSRRRLTGLDEASLLDLGGLPDGEAVDLLRSVSGRGLTPTDAPAVQELITLCEQLPLAIRIVAARLRDRPALSMQVLAGQLRDEQGRLGRLKDDDRDLTAVFESSFKGLPETERQLFRLLGLVVGPDFDTYAAANLAATTTDLAEQSVDSLVRASLVSEQSPGRYRLHDLTRLYARSVLARSDRDEREAALARLLDYYQRVTQAADRFIRRHDRPGETPQAPSVTAGPEIQDEAEALAVLRAERPNLLATAAALATDEPSRLVALSGSVAAFLRQDGPWPDAVALHTQAVTQARELHDRLAEANSLHDLGRALFMMGDLPGATEAVERALTFYSELGDDLGEANALQERGRFTMATGDWETAGKDLSHALEIYRGMGNRLGEAFTLYELSRAGRLAGDGSEAVGLLAAAGDILELLGHRFGEAAVLLELGQLKRTAGVHAQALALLERAVVNFRLLGHRQATAVSLLEIARVHEDAGRHQPAGELAQRAVSLHRSLGDRQGEVTALWVLGRVQRGALKLSAAVDSQERALALSRELGYRLGEAGALNELGRLCTARGEYREAERLLQQALALHRSVGIPQGEAETLSSTGDLLAATGHPRDALTAYRQAARLAREINSAADEIRALQGAAKWESGPQAASDLRRLSELRERAGTEVG